MKSFGKYISRHLLTFASVIIALVILNVLTFGITFYKIIAKDYGEASFSVSEIRFCPSAVNDSAPIHQSYKKTISFLYKKQIGRASCRERV